jgi:hypothetical protein
MGQDDELAHVYCDCSEDVAYCGADLTGVEEGYDPDDLLCVVCDDMAYLPCPRCGVAA